VQQSMCSPAQSATKGSAQVLSPIRCPTCRPCHTSEPTLDTTKAVPQCHRLEVCKGAATQHRVNTQLSNNTPYPHNKRDSRPGSCTILYAPCPMPHRQPLKHAQLNSGQTQHGPVNDLSSLTPSKTPVSTHCISWRGESRPAFLTPPPPAAFPGYPLHALILAVMLTVVIESARRKSVAPLTSG
jgi:hypothetical protein